MLVLFLDIDGVLNSGNYIRRLDGRFDDPNYQIDAEAVVRLNAITQLTGASIVVSSTWRLAFKRSADPARQMGTCLTAYKITAPVIGITGERHDGRKNEIREWLQEHPEVDNFVILDDETIEGFTGHTVKTEFATGLQDEHVRQALTILGYK